ncbi:unnamed protein product [Psylliodes chrysocephalus]|uniref:Uncharacterized protein n=1 Tax=Psylliodes chrysocephalus TaxID=3402493 RepID=A0A9P0CRC1_9CUCU|nr:unnamed protein product [Psylliodes chrysocephala]
MEKANKLSQKQEKLGKHLLTNLKKDSESRKIEENIENRFSELEELWQAVQQNHILLEDLDIPNHNYFKCLYSDQIKLKYDKAKQYLTMYPKAIDENQSQLPHLECNQENKEHKIKFKKQLIKIEQLDRLIQKAGQEILEAKLTFRSWLTTNIDRLWESI